MDDFDFKLRCIIQSSSSTRYLVPIDGLRISMSFVPSSVPHLKGMCIPMLRDEDFSSMKVSYYSSKASINYSSTSLMNLANPLS